MSKHKTIRFIIHYVKPTAQLLFTIRFPKGWPTVDQLVLNKWMLIYIYIIKIAIKQVRTIFIRYNEFTVTSISDFLRYLIVNIYNINAMLYSLPNASAQFLSSNKFVSPGLGVIQCQQWVPLSWMQAYLRVAGYRVHLACAFLCDVTLQIGATLLFHES